MGKLGGALAVLAALIIIEAGGTYLYNEYVRDEPLVDCGNGVRVEPGTRCPRDETAQTDETDDDSEDDSEDEPKVTPTPRPPQVTKPPASPRFTSQEAAKMCEDSG